jgi:hypothetical protein
VVFMPLVGGGFFSRGDLELITGSLLGHLLYGGSSAGAITEVGMTDSSRIVGLLGRR